ncbi:MAG: glycosyltransferase [Anaerolineales bacterium]|nr:glycosyltransferase [Anaerolineales bacterium]
MRILYLCADPGIPVRGHKGAAVHVRAMCAALSRLGHDVTLIAARIGPTDGPQPAARVIDASGSDDGSGAGPSAAARVAMRAQELLAIESFDFVYERYALWSAIGSSLAKTNGLPFVLEVNSPLIDEAREHRGLDDVAAAQAVARAQFSGAARLALVSEALRAHVLGLGADPARVEIVPNGVDPIAFHPAVIGTHIRRRLGLQQRHVIGFVGRPRPWHDLPTLLAAVESLHVQDPAYALLLVGDMPDDVKALAARRPDLVFLTGALDHDRVPAHIAAMDVAVSSHHARDDFYFSPLKLYEYLACGIPTVAADIGQQADVLRETDGGWLYPPGDSAALAERISQILAEPEDSRSRAWQGATAVLGRYTWDQNAARVCDWIAPEPAPVVPMTGPIRRTPLLDPRLRQRLFRATRKDLVAPFIARGLGERAPAELAVTAIDVLKYKPRRRAVLRYHLVGAPWAHVIGKVFRDDRAGRLFDIQAHLWESGFGPQAEDGIRVAEPIAVIPELRAFLQEQVPGQTLNELAGTGVALDRQVEQAAVGLAKLHAVAWQPDWTPLNPYTLDTEVAQLGIYAADLTALRPDLTADMADLLEALRGWAGQLPAPAQLRPVHRDFYYSQVLVDGPRLALIDFDLIALGDPAIDVANFLAHLTFLGLDLAGDADRLRPQAERFLTAYRRRRATQPGFEARVEFYTAATYFRLMNVVVGRPALTHLVDALHRLTLKALLPA